MAAALRTCTKRCTATSHEITYYVSQQPRRVWRDCCNPGIDLIGGIGLEVPICAPSQPYGLMIAPPSVLQVLLLVFKTSTRPFQEHQECSGSACEPRLELRWLRHEIRLSANQARSHHARVFSRLRGTMKLQRGFSIPSKRKHKEFCKALILAVASRNKYLPYRVFHHGRFSVTGR